MIELKNVSKIYKSKKSTNTLALKDISIKFPEKGMVFILGKSGSGKSTLLNIIGGLDKYDDGDVVINGKSTKKFKEKDFNAFRNTYMGFIFQEYNLLENYSIEQNIKLSLELQHKKATKEEVQKALNQVELEDISKRKTNELSGGQKQRVAIARALIKNPEIILADEPTGNLDSNTSKQIWEILKKLSKDKLVIVVSHDSESAEEYADRIIELHDGQIISDQGNTEITETKSFKLQGAKLPFYYSFKMGVGSLLHKKLKLIFSTLLIVFSLICFGVMLSAYRTDLNDETLRVFSEKGPTEVSISKYKTSINFIDIMEEQRKMAEEQDMNKLQELEEKYNPIEINENFEKEVEKNTGMDWKAVYTIDTADGMALMVYPSTLQNQDNMPVYYSLGSDNLSLSFLKSEDMDTENLIGTKPQNDDEVVITSYIADCLIYRGCLAKNANDEKLEETKFEPKNYNEIISSGKYINFCNIAHLKVVGIIDYTDTLKEYAPLKNVKMAELMYDTVGEEISELTGKMSYDIWTTQSRVYVNQSFITKKQNTKNSFLVKNTKIKYDNTEQYINTIAYINPSLEIFTDSGFKTITELNNNEIIINEAILDCITNYNYSTMYEQNINKYNSKEEFLYQYLKDNGIIGKTIKSNVNNGKIVSNENEYIEYKIAGVTIDEMQGNSTLIIYYSKNIVEPLMTSNVHCFELVRNVNTVQEMETILKYYPVQDSDTLSASEYSNAVGEAATISYLFSFVAKYGVAFFLVFSAIILMTFINSSIRFRKKEIGTLRALGCRSKDIIVMFLYESIILMLISLGISFAIIPKIISAVNNFIIKELLIDIQVLRFGLNQILEISVIMLAIVVLANVIPVRKITKMKPIDAILNK